MKKSRANTTLVLLTDVAAVYPVTAAAAPDKLIKANKIVHPSIILRSGSATLSGKSSANFKYPPFQSVRSQGWLHAAEFVTMACSNLRAARIAHAIELFRRRHALFGITRTWPGSVQFCVKSQRRR